MSNIAGNPDIAIAARSSAWRAVLQQDDWWAIWIGLGLVVVAAALATRGSSIAWIAVAPQKWNQLSELARQLHAHAIQYVALFGLWATLFGIAARALGLNSAQFVASFGVLFIATLGLYGLGQWSQAAHYNLEPPLVALIIGALVSNTVGLPAWLENALRVELYIKTGIVVLGAGLPLTLMLWAGPVVVLQAGIVSLVTFAVIHLTATGLGLDKRFAATLGTGGAVCGVSGAIAVAGAVRAKKEHVSVAISLVVLWAIVMIFALPLVSQRLGLSTGVAGAWIGTSEFADAAGLAAAQTYSSLADGVHGISGRADAAVNAFTLMKVIGRDVWIGIWALALSIVATTRWETTGIEGRASGSEIWRRFPKFVMGFVVASALVTAVSSGDGYADYKKAVLPALVAPLQVLRTWAFTFAFLSIGLTTRFREFAGIRSRPLIAFTVGVLVNVLLGLWLSTRVFNGFWNHLAQ